MVTSLRCRYINHRVALSRRTELHREMKASLRNFATYFVYFAVKIHFTILNKTLFLTWLINLVRKSLFSRHLIEAAQHQLGDVQ